MPLVMLCGLPCAGKTSVATMLAKYLKEAGQDVALIDDSIAHLSRNEGYKDGHAEKRVRGALKANVERAVSKRTTVLLDSLNSIKGYRYELWCVARAAATRYCVVHCHTPADVAQRWNAARDPEAAYSSKVFEDLAGRFETPDSRNRWEKPLHTVHLDQPGWEAVVQAIAASLLDNKPAQAIKVATTSAELQPTSATSNPELLGTNLLHAIDAAVQEVVAAIMAAQSQQQPDAAGCLHIDLPGCAEPLTLQRRVTLPELRSAKRQFIKSAMHTSSRLQDASSAKGMFTDFLTDSIN